ncbi:MAG TPA: hypothetical protein PKK00_12250 [Bacteroidales bacterium]|nr:hypothetical protein [Bacteroidales bacterium]HPS17821.1 hypothetical protein [Bacteroidales bacterium]
MKNIDEKDFAVVLSAVITLRDMVVKSDDKKEFNEKLLSNIKYVNYSYYLEIQDNIRKCKFYDELFFI